jgi:hypothetical protein
VGVRSAHGAGADGGGWPGSTRLRLCPFTVVQWHTRAWLRRPAADRAVAGASSGRMALTRAGGTSGITVRIGWGARPGRAPRPGRPGPAQPPSASVWGGQSGCPPQTQPCGCASCERPRLVGHHLFRFPGRFPEQPVPYQPVAPARRRMRPTRARFVAPSGPETQQTSPSCVSWPPPARRTGRTIRTPAPRMPSARAPQPVRTVIPDVSPACVKAMRPDDAPGTSRSAARPAQPPIPSPLDNAGPGRRRRRVDSSHPPPSAPAQ